MDNSMVRNHLIHLMHCLALCSVNFLTLIVKKKSQLLPVSNFRNLWYLRKEKFGSGEAIVSSSHFSFHCVFRCEKQDFWTLESFQGKLIPRLAKEGPFLKYIWPCAVSATRCHRCQRLCLAFAPHRETQRMGSARRRVCLPCLSS